MATVPTRSGSPRQLTTKQTGDAWEAQARRWLEGKGLRFIAANVNERGGEIDLIMREGRTTVFVEVRYRQQGQAWHNSSTDNIPEVPASPAPAGISFPADRKYPHQVLQSSLQTLCQCMHVYHLHSMRLIS